MADKQLSGKDWARGCGYLIVVAFTLMGCGSGRSSSDIQSVAQVLADHDHATDDTPYVTAVTTLSRRCTQNPEDIATADIEPAQRLLEASGDTETRLAVLQAVVKVTDVNPQDSRQDCEAMAKGLTRMVQGR
jgi:hypothetical protein